jgi:hypothetical protein
MFAACWDTTSRAESLANYDISPAFLRRRGTGWRGFDAVGSPHTIPRAPLNNNRARTEQEAGS